MNILFSGSSYGFGAFRSASQCSTMRTHFSMVSEGNVEENLSKVSFCFALMRMAAWKRFAKWFPSPKIRAGHEDRIKNTYENQQSSGNSTHSSDRSKSHVEPLAPSHAHLVQADLYVTRWFRPPHRTSFPHPLYNQGKSRFCTLRHVQWCASWESRSRPSCLVWFSYFQENRTCGCGNSSTIGSQCHMLWISKVR